MVNRRLPGRPVLGPSLIVTVRRWAYERVGRE
jgi:hypothetical protein